MHLQAGLRLQLSTLHLALPQQSDGPAQLVRSVQTPPRQQIVLLALLQDGEGALVHALRLAFATQVAQRHRQDAQHVQKGTLVGLAQASGLFQLRQEGHG